LAAAVIWVFAVWRLTTPEPALSRRPVRARAIVALSLAPFAALALMMLFGMVAHGTGRVRPGGGIIFAMVMGHGACIAIFVAVFLLLGVIRQVGRRDPNTRLSRLLTLLIWSLGLVGVGVLLTGGSFMFAPIVVTATSSPAGGPAATSVPAGATGGAGTGWWRGARLAVLMILQIAILVWGVCWIVSLFQFRAMCTRAMRRNVYSELTARK
jgi:hypothetical protein